MNIPLFPCWLRLTGRALHTASQPFLLVKPAPPRGNLSQQKRRKCNTLFRCVLHSRLPSAAQRYNTLDFPDGKSCAKGTPSPLDTPAKGNSVSLWIPYANRDAARPYWMTQSQKEGAALLWRPPKISAAVDSQTAKCSLTITP